MATETKEVKQTLQEKVMSKPKTSKFLKRDLGTVYMEKVSDFQVNSDLRKIPENMVDDKDLVSLFESIQLNGFDQSSPIVVDINTGWIITGNRRFYCAEKQGHKTIPVLFKDVKDYVSYMRAALYLNNQKKSTISELAPHVRAMRQEGMTPEEIAETWKISIKSVYDIFRVNDPEIAKNDKIPFSSKIVLCDAKYRPFIGKEDIKQAEKISTVDLKKALNSKKLIALTGDDKKEEVKAVISYDKDRKELFFAQLANFNKETIDVSRLKRFLTKELKNWF